ncbi:PRC-barrel domain containing protein [Streptomyces sp. NPDC000229]|uniref:PRC-barrel domain containing protein n=1 Tax=Streptomyces sp. NPDC000229 TaxID=3154247 RepID=UPI00331D8D39
MSENIWEYHPAAGHVDGALLVGYEVEATDGNIGKVDKHSDEVGSAYLVVDTGPWIFGKRVLLPAGTVTEINLETHTVFVGRTREQVKNAPDFDQDKHLDDPEYHRVIGGYYGTPAM